MPIESAIGDLAVLAECDSNRMRAALDLLLEELMEAEILGSGDVCGIPSHKHLLLFGGGEHGEIREVSVWMVYDPFE